MTTKKSLKEACNERDHFQRKYEQAMNQVIEMSQKINKLEQEIEELKLGYTISDRTDVDEWKGAL